jgi:ABC-type multidrug transport system permease subunit
MALMVGTTWLDLPMDQSAVQDRFSVLFFTVAFLCFMSVAGIPAFIEDKAVYDRETSNAVYDVLPYVISNTIVSLPFIFLIAIVYTAIAYPLVKLHSGFDRAMKFLLSLFLSLYTVESIVLIISASFPIFVVALALTAFLNGFFMVVQGFFVSMSTLPNFWTWAHYWGYQTYGFEMMIENEFPGLTFSCAYVSQTECFCSIPSDLNSQCQFSGQDVLNAYDYSSIDYWKWVWVMLAQIVGYKLIFFGILWFKRWNSMKGT